MLCIRQFSPNVPAWSKFVGPSLRNSSVLAGLASLAYSNREAIEEFGRQNHVDIQFFEQDNAFGIGVEATIESVPVMFLSIRGTEPPGVFDVWKRLYARICGLPLPPSPWSDLMDDLTISRVPACVGDGALIMEGFERHASLLWPQIKEWLLKHRNLPGLVIAAGSHSLGAAVTADIHLRSAVELGLPWDFCNLYGCPRIYNRRGANAYDRECPNTVRFVNRADIVTGIPWPIRFKHVGQDRVFRIGTLGSKVTKRDCLWRMAHFGKHFAMGKWWGPVDDHSHRTYYHELQSCFEMKQASLDCGVGF